MEYESGSKNFPVWIMSDIEPSYLEAELDGPFDYRHPVRHIVCTSILNVIQHYVYQNEKERLDEENLYFRTTISENAEKPRINDVIWPDEVMEEVESIKNDIENYKPTIILSFGAYTYEILRRTNIGKTHRSYGSWTPDELGGEFKACLSEFDINQTNVFPLMDRSILGWKFLQSHEQFVGQKNADYFKFAGKRIAGFLNKYRDELDVWAKSS